MSVSVIAEHNGVNSVNVHRPRQFYLNVVSFRIIAVKALLRRESFSTLILSAINGDIESLNDPSD